MVPQMKGSDHPTTRRKSCSCSAGRGAPCISPKENPGRAGEGGRRRKGLTLQLTLRRRMNTRLVSGDKRGVNRVNGCSRGKDRGLATHCNRLSPPSLPCPSLSSSFLSSHVLPSLPSSSLPPQAWVSSRFEEGSFPL